MNATISPAVRREIETTLVADGFVQAPTLAAHLIASAFTARLVEARRDGRFLSLVAWTERTCERYAALPGVAAMLGRACGVARDVLQRRRIYSAGLESDLVAVEGSIAATLARLAASRAYVDADAGELDATIAAFLLKLDDADPMSAEHSRAVALWCRRLARRLALSHDECVFVARGGMLHDVGKTLTPKEILLAPRRLSDDEFAVMREHAAIGGAMVREVERLRAFMPLVRNHHERIDGRGYPDGLRGDEISLHVRIVTVADCFNAMIGRRPYRLPMSPAEALEQLVDHRGTQFDPMVVEAMVDIIERPES